MTDRFLIAGAGLGGSLAAALLARAGHQVHVYERRADPRRGPVDAGRSINLAISARGLFALGRIGCADQVLGMGVPLYGRLIHSPTGSLTYQAYGTGKQCINSVPRAALNQLLVESAEAAGARIEFGRRSHDVDLIEGTLTTVDNRTGEDSRTVAGAIIGADGAYSSVRAAMQRREWFDYSQDYLEHGYKELEIPPGPNGTHRLEPNALHIWPRGGYMMMAMANQNGSFTVTLYMRIGGERGFASLATPADVLRFFERDFPDAIPLIPELTDDFFTHPTGSLLTIRSHPWHVDGKAVLLGDAAHAIVPFYGQGANAAFEDGVALLEAIDAHPGQLGRAFERYEAIRKPNTDAIADLAIANFHEMRDHVASPFFLAKKRLQKLLHALVPRWFIPLYPMISFSTIPYAEAKARAERQERVLKAIGIGFAVVLCAVGALLLL